MWSVKQVKQGICTPLFLLAIAFSSLLLGGCGFTPMYGNKNDLTNPFKVNGLEELQAIKIGAIPNRDGQLLRNALLERLNPYGEPQSPQYRLTTDLNFTKSGIAVRRDGTFQRYKVTGTANFSLIDLQTGKILYKDTASQVSTFIVTDSTAGSAFSATVSERSEEKNLTRLIADEMTLSILSFLERGDHLLDTPDSKTSSLQQEQAPQNSSHLEKVKITRLPLKEASCDKNDQL